MKEIINQAEKEIKEEDYRKAVDSAKKALRSKRKLRYWLPKIKIEWRKGNA